MKLYIGNTTRQNVEFAYRIPDEKTGVRTQTIGIGQQIQITGELSAPQVDAIIDHHRNYGLVNVSEIDRTKPFIGLCYSVDKKIPVDKIINAMEHNQEVLIDRGRQMRKEAAVSANNLIDSHLREQNSEATLQNFEMTVEEENRGKRDDDGLLSEGVTVSKSADPEEKTSNRKQNNRNGGKRP